MAVTDPGAEVRIRELRRRVTQDPTSPLFLALAEECRAAGNLPEAILILEKGVSTYARYVSAQVSLGRAYLEAGRIEESIAMLSRALASDGGNPVAARSLADIYLSRCEQVEAVKKYKLYRALSGDRSVDEIIGRIEAEIPPAPAPAAEPPGRILADLYLEQGHSAEALAIYDELARANPADAEVSRLRAEAASRLPDQGPTPSLPSDGDISRRQAKVLALKRWLSVIETR